MQCPICKKTVKNREDKDQPNPYFPFCSERCKLIDLGRWLDGKYQVPVEIDPDDDAADDPAIGGP
jgi:endogenous inhibitor of DNA gyrase (YacG/DUF329 family)